MVVLHWSEDRDIKRLCEVSGMGRESKGYDLMVPAVLDKFASPMRSMAVEKEHSIFSCLSALGEHFEMFQPLKRNEIIGTV